MPETPTVRSTKSMPGFHVFGMKKRLAGPLPDRVSIHGAREVSQVVDQLSKRDVLISCAEATTIALLKARLVHGHHSRSGQLIVIEPPSAASVSSLLGVFAEVLGLGVGSRFLPIGDLLKVVTSSDAAARFIGGDADPASESLTLVRGNRETIVLPFSFFEPSAEGTKPDFRQLRITDHGHTVALGEYEAAADAILYETDPAYRRQLNKARQASDRSFGASLRRLRLQRRLQRGDFAGITAKTIARIERNEVDKPRGKTLAVIAERLGVAAVDIDNY